MNEIPQIIERNEKILYDSKPEYAPYIIRAFFLILIISGIAGLVIGGGIFKSPIFGLILGIVVFIIGFIIANMAYNRIHYAITNKRAIIQSGIIGRDFKSIDYDRIQNASVSVGILGVIFKVGSIRIFTGELESTGGKHSRIRPKYDVFDYVPFPYEVLRKLQEHLSTRKENLYK